MASISIRWTSFGIRLNLRAALQQPINLPEVPDAVMFVWTEASEERFFFFWQLVESVPPTLVTFVRAK